MAPFRLAIRIAAGLGCSAVDLSVSSDSRHVPLQRVLADPAGSADDVLELTRAYSVQVADIRADAAEVDGAAAAQLIAFARRCGAAVVTLGCSADRGEILTAFARLALAAGVRAAIEACPGTSPRAVAEAAAATEVGVALDYGTFLSSGISEDQASILLPLTTHLRIRGVAPGAFQVAWRENTVNYADAIEALRSRGFDGYVAADYVWDPSLGRNRNDTIAETVQMRRELNQPR